MAKGLYPIIGLAAAAALAVALVFGAASLANPAFASTDQPVDASLADQDAPGLMVLPGDKPTISIGDTQMSREVDMRNYFKIGPTDGTFSRPHWYIENPPNSESSHKHSMGNMLEIPRLNPLNEAEDYTLTVTGYQRQVRAYVGGDRITSGTCSGAWSSPMELPLGCYHMAERDFEVKTEGLHITASTESPAGSPRYVIKYIANNKVDALDGLIKLEMEDFDVPSIDVEDIVIRADAGAAHPEAIETDDEEIILHMGDLHSDDDLDGIVVGDMVTITIQASAGVRLPSEGGDYAWTIAGEGSSGKVIHVARKISLNEDEGGRGDMITATGKGFKNGTSIHFWLDTNNNRMQDDDEYTLCSAVVNGDDVGECQFEVTAPPFEGGPNHINAVDGRSNIADWEEQADFELESSISVTPDGGSPGESLLVELFDFGNESASVIKVELARKVLCTGGDCSGTVSSSGNGNFRLIVPDDAPAGVQDLRVTVAPNLNASTTITISGPMIRVTPEDVVANQRVSLVGSGFNAGASICRGDSDSCMGSEISIGGHPIMWSRINGGNPVEVDSGGNWSAAVDLPLDSATVEEGNREIRVRDSMGRTGKVVVHIPAREVTITPETGRVGTLATVQGKNFPSKNDEGDSFSVEIVYESATGRTTVSAQPDASGRFETQIRIPTTAGIPSTNTVKVQYEYGTANTAVVTAVTHDVPEGIINLSTTSGSPGSTITITGEGFKSFVPVSVVKVGPLEVTPAPKPSTDAQGMLNFDITIPGLDNGIQTIEVHVGQTTASKGFTVTPSAQNPGNIVPVADGVSNLGDSFVRVFYFNNDSKQWAFYDPRPDVVEASDLFHLITGETYLFLVTSDTEAILNGRTRNLTCVGGNCWNQIVW